jgi:predicted metal-dependent hydrolase
VAEPPRDRYGRPLPPGSADELAHAERPAGDWKKACRRAIELFDQQRFFEAHEFFEYVWKAGDVEESDRRFWKAVTQVAVGCCHVQRGNAPGALALLERAEARLGGYASPHRGIDTSGLVALIRATAARVRAQGATPAFEFLELPVAGADPGG